MTGSYVNCHVCKASSVSYMTTAGVGFCSKCTPVRPLAPPAPAGATPAAPTGTPSASRRARSAAQRKAKTEAAATAAPAASATSRPPPPTNNEGTTTAAAAATPTCFTCSRIARRVTAEDGRHYCRACYNNAKPAASVPAAAGAAPPPRDGKKQEPTVARAPPGGATGAGATAEPGGRLKFGSCRKCTAIISKDKNFCDPCFQAVHREKMEAQQQAASNVVPTCTKCPSRSTNRLAPDGRYYCRKCFHAMRAAGNFASSETPSAGELRHAVGVLERAILRFEKAAAQQRSTA